MIVLRGAEIKDYADAKGNTVTGVPENGGNGSWIEFQAKNCHVTFEPGARMMGVIVLLRDNATVHIGARTVFRGRMGLGLGCTVSFGDDVYCGSDLHITTAEGASVTFGNDVLIANHVKIRGDDSHPIYDGVTGERINRSQPITIGDHVWIGQETYILSGSRVGNGSIIGARSVVTKSRPVPEHVIAAGVPAKVQRRNVHWLRKHLQTDHTVPETITPIFDAGELPEVGRKSLLAHLVSLFR